MLEKLAAVEARYEELNRLMADPQVATNPDLLREYGQETAEKGFAAEGLQPVKRLGDDAETAEYAGDHDEGQRPGPDLVALADKFAPDRAAPGHRVPSVCLTVI